MTGDFSSRSLRVSIDDLHSFCVAALTKVGVSQADAATTADVLVTTDSWGVFTHGVKALRGYIRRIRGGGLNPTARPQVVDSGPGWAIVDGHSALGMVTSVLAMQTAIDKARACGIGFVGVRNSCHFGAAGYYPYLAAKQDLIGIAMANDIPSVTAPDARADHREQSAGVCRPQWQRLADHARHGHEHRGRRKSRRRACSGKPIPDNWVIDSAGVPSTDPAAFIHGGA